MHIGPSNSSALLADTKISYVGQIMPRAVPGTVHQGFEIGAFHEHPLFRKLYILDDKTAVVVAGCSKAIGDFLGDAEQAVVGYPDDEFPMDRIARLAERHKDQLEFIGSSMIQEPGKEPGFHLRSNYDGEILQHVGRVFAIGSGRRDLLERVKLFDQNMAAGPNMLQPDPHEQIRGVCSALNNSRMADEMISPEIADENWGGFIEHAYFDFEQEKWRYGPRSVHMFFITELHAPGRIATGLVGKVVAYEPGVKHGCVLAVTVGKDKVPSIHRWGLQNLLESHDIDEIDVFYSNEFWVDWKPLSATVTVIPQHQDGLYIVHKTLEWHQVSEVRFNILGDKRDLGISEELASEIMPTICKAWGQEWYPGD